jgi:hypothetical protein
MILPDAPAPASTGVRVRIGTFLDATLPASGWTSKAKGRRWIFADRRGSNGGVVRVDLVSAAADRKRVTFKVAATTDPANAVPQAMAAHLSFASNACAAVSWNGPDGAVPRCSGRAGRVACR